MHFHSSLVLATALCTAQLGSAAAISSSKTSSSASATASEIPNFPFSNTTIENLTSILNLIVAIPDDVINSEESVADYFSEKLTCLNNTATQKLKLRDTSAGVITGTPEFQVSTIPLLFSTQTTSALPVSVTEIRTMVVKARQGSSDAPIPSGDAPVASGSDEAPITSSPTDSTPTKAGGNLIPKITALIPSAGLAKASSVLAGVKSKIGGSNPVIGGIESNLLGKATGIIGSLIAPQASKVIGNIESKITAAIPGASGVVSFIDGQLPSIASAIGGLLNGIGLKERDEESCLGVAIFTDVESIKECVDGLAVSAASEDLVALKAAVVAAGGVAKVEAGVEGEAPENDVLIVLAMVVEFGKKVEACQILA